MREKWKVIEVCPSYMISNHGRVCNTLTNRIMKANLSRGYLKIYLGSNYEYKTYLIHRLVAFAFVDGYFEGAIVNHKDGRKTNNFSSNLEWITQGENVRHAIVTGLFPRRFRIVETGDIFQRVTTCAVHIGGNPDAILKCLNGTMKTHKGYTFEYVK